MERTAQPKPLKGTAKRAKARGKRREAKADRLVYAAVDARDGHRCRVCLDYCGVDIHRHHIVYRSQGGETSTANVAHLCEACHLAVHAHRVKLSGNADVAIKVKAATIYVNGVGQQWASYSSYAHGVAA